MNTYNKITSLNVANYFLSLKDYEDLTNLKIQKMIYYAYGWHLALHDNPLFDERFEAWDYGPVIPRLYHAFKKYKDRPVPVARDFNSNIIGDKTKFLDDIYIKYGHYSANKLCDLTHIKSTPWYVVYNDDSTNCIINNQLLKVYFVELKELLHSQKNIDQFRAAKTLAKDEALSETMYILSHPKDVQALTEALERSAKGKIIQFDWRNVN